MTADRHAPPDETVPKPVAVPGPDSIVNHLLLLANLIARPFFDRYARDHDLTLPEWRVLLDCCRQEGRSGAEVGESTGLPPMSVSRAVARLLRSGRLFRDVDPQDRRRQRLWPTAAGVAVVNAIFPEAQRREETVLADLSADDRSRLLEDLRRMIEAARATVKPQPKARVRIRTGLPPAPPQGSPVPPTTREGRSHKRSTG